MKNIDIVTTQNVTLEYELADLRDRMIAFLIDFLIIWAIIGILSVIGFNIFYLSNTGGVVFGVFLGCVFIFYSLAFEVFNNGQSLGKKAMKIQVIKLKGGRASFSDYAARWAFRMIDIYFSLGGVASFLIASSVKAQRIGDVVAQTAVIKLEPKLDLKLTDVLGIQSKENYTPQFPEVKQLKDEDILLVKQVVERYQQYKNDAHKQRVLEMSASLRDVLKIDRPVTEPLKFLQTIIKDYIVATRS
ncbi:MAG: RDD family protein [Chryseotalea sp.]|jgi:uncharacterized RDD family membrane protein YckC|nr:RDD family protein [Flammeovirgaceae bacterium]